MANVRPVMQSCDPQLLDLCGDLETTDSAEASPIVVFLTDSQRVQKILWRQLFVLDSMVSLVEELKSAQQLLTQPCPAPPDGGARSRWKALKQQYRSGLEEMENLLWTQLQKIQQINTKREKVKQLLQRLQQQSKHKEELQEALLKAHNALQQRDRQLEQLRAEFKAVASHMIDWEQIRDDLQMEVSLVQNMMNMKLLSLSASELCLELCLELSPGPGLGSGLGSGPGSPSDLDPLRLTVKWGPDESFSLQVSAEACGLVEGCASGRKSDLSATLLDVLQSYMGQAELLTEIQTLRSRFAIDWKPAQRCLVFLKSAALVCELFVEEGYPRTGSARLLTVRRDGLSLDTSDLQWKRTDLSLSRWLLLLSSSPLL